MPTETSEITDALIKFRDQRDWKQFHNPKDLAIAINIEAGELLELFLWKKPEDANNEKIKEELADIFTFCFFLAERQGLNVKEIILEKLRKSDEKYPVDKSKGTAKKYNEL
jgi:NTP pyrophosphatase (non-canonical NTP hydrolase)